jgi:hypothetical protein
MQSVRYKNGRGEEEKIDGNKSTKINNERQEETVNKTITNLHKKNCVEQRR